MPFKFLVHKVPGNQPTLMMKSFGFSPFTWTTNNASRVRLLQVKHTPFSDMQNRPVVDWFSLKSYTALNEACMLCIDVQQEVGEGGGGVLSYWRWKINRPTWGQCYFVVTCSNSWKSQWSLNAACPLSLNDPLDFSNIMLLLRLHP